MIHSASGHTPSVGLGDKMNQEGKTPKRRYKSNVVRERKILSCKHCYSVKRKCDKSRPICLRCQKTNHKCEYFPTIEKSKNKQETDQNKLSEPVSDELGNNIEKPKLQNDPLNDEDHVEGHLTIKQSPITKLHTKPSLSNILNTEINPQVGKEENNNFTLVISSTGEYSKFFPTCIFPFHDHQSNLSMVLNFNDQNSRSLSSFDFSILSPILPDLESIKMTIPNVELMDFLIDHFIKFILPFVPIIDTQEFLYDYRKLWQNFEEFNDMNFLVILFAITFASTTNILLLKDLKKLNLYDKFDNHFIMKQDCNALRLQSYYCIDNLKSMLNSDTTPSISLIIGLTIVYYVGSYNGSHASMQIAGLVKHSQFFGLHRRLIASPTELPMRDVIYSFVWYLDGLGAYYTGFPPNMYYEFFQCNHDSLANSNDINIIFLRGRLHNTRVWNRILFEFNKINKTSEAAFDEVEKLYDESLNQVNAINELIKHNTQASEEYKSFLMTETRMGLRKSALLINALRNAVKNMNMDDYKKNITPQLALQAILLVNESIYKARLGADVIKESIWFYRFAIPFQAMYIILSHLQLYPEQSLNFSMLDDKYDYTIIPEYTAFDYVSGDIRLKLVDYCIRTLSFLMNFWSAAQIERFETIIKYRNFVYDLLKQSNQNTPTNINSELPSDLRKDTSSENVSNDEKVSQRENSVPVLQDFDLFGRMMFDPALLDDHSNFWINEHN